MSLKFDKNFSEGNLDRLTGHILPRIRIQLWRGVAIQIRSFVGSTFNSDFGPTFAEPVAPARRMPPRRLTRLKYLRMV
ncbi:hypothetical protein GC098_30775 [Paenibacillus sp. LMG 31458]|uniref:Uncharacterized protein n=1 Tax=Paenibacillus phytorum TaxID=2654977 RepID=A0ABX1Y6L1_9BACL|nr:hypothetical protein [Paenibacillus phytorum]